MGYIITRNHTYIRVKEDGKKYYNSIKSLNNLVNDARKFNQTILMVGDITDK